jgi:hypothetical protein
MSPPRSAKPQTGCYLLATEPLQALPAREVFWHLYTCFVRAGPSMLLTSIGIETRRAVLLVLHDAAQPWMTITSDWTPTAQCPDS